MEKLIAFLMKLGLLPRESIHYIGGSDVLPAPLKAEAEQQALAQLKFSKVYSHVSKKNAASMAVHSRCGFEKILDYAAYIDGSVNHSAVTLLWQPKESVAECAL